MQSMMSMLYYTLIGIVLYMASDWLLNYLEAKRGKLFPSRSLVFFGIILVLSVITFEIIGQFLEG